MIIFVLISVSFFVARYECKNPKDLTYEDIRDMINNVDISRKEAFVRSFITYPTKRDSVFKDSIVEFVNSEDKIDWGKIIGGEDLKHPKLHKIYPYELLKDFLRIVANVSEDMLIDYCDDVIIYCSGFHLIRIKNEEQNYGVVAFIEINRYRDFLLANILGKGDSFLLRIGNYIFSNWGVILSVILSGISMTVVFLQNYFGKKKKKE